MKMSNRRTFPLVPIAKETPKYTLYIVSRSRDHHYPVLMANNGKVALNEPSGRAAKLEISARRFIDACSEGYTTIERITEADFKAKYHSFAPNKGGKKKAEKDHWVLDNPSTKPKPRTQPFKKGDKVVVNAGVWGKCKATVMRRGLHEGDWRVRITEGPHKGHEGTWDQMDITKA